MKRFLFFILLCQVFVFSNANAQNYALEVLPDKEVIYINKLALPGNLSVKDLLLMYPSILNRNVENAIERYEVQLDNKTIGAANDEILVATKLREIEKIEISSSPSVTQQKNGQGGVINLILNKPEEEGVSGSASLFTFTSVDVMPTMNLDYKRGGLLIRSKFNFEYYNAEKDYEINEKDILYEINSKKWVRDNYWDQAAKVDLVYTSPSGNDVFKFWLSEVADRNDNTTRVNQHRILDKTAEIGEGWTFNEYSESEDKVRTRMFALMAASQYEHFFGKDHRIKLACDYNYSRMKDIRDEDKEQTIYPKNFQAEMQYKVPLLRGDYSLIMESGANYTGSADKVYAQKQSSVYASPYLNLKYKHGEWAINAGARYQYYKYLTSRKDWTFNLNAVWQMLDHHALRFIGTKNVARPSESMLDPSFVKSPLDGSWHLGNPDLRPSSIYTAAVKYIHDWTQGTSSFIFAFGFGYHYTHDGIETVNVNWDNRLIPYVTYINSNIKRTLVADVNLVYNYDIFSCTFTGNYFRSREHGFDDSEDKYRYFNLSLSPVFRFRHQWSLGSRMIYNSRVKALNSTEGECFFMCINLNKTFGQWSLFAEMADIFGYKTWDETFTGESHVMNTGHHLYQRHVALGFTYKF